MIWGLVSSAEPPSCELSRDYMSTQYCLIENSDFFLAALGLRCCMRALSSCGQWGLLFIAVHGLLIVVASHCSGFSCCGAWALGAWASVVVACRLSSCGARAYLLHGMWDLPGPGLEKLVLALPAFLAARGLAHDLG